LSQTSQSGCPALDIGSVTVKDYPGEEAGTAILIGASSREKHVVAGGLPATKPIPPIHAASKETALIVFDLLIVILIGSILGIIVAPVLLKKAEKDGRVGFMGW
jgi:hypothetical protein